MRELPAASLLDAAPCGLIVTAVDGTMLSVNATFCHWIGHDCADLIGKVRFAQLLSVGGRVFHQTHWEPLLQMQGSVAEVKVEVLHRDGRKLPMLLNATRRVHEGAEYQQYALIIVNDRHKYERELLKARNASRDLNEQLSRANRLKTEFLATLAHELRNPLAPIRNGLQILKSSRSADDHERTRAMMDRQVSHMVRLIDDLLDVSRIASAKVELRRSTITLQQVIDAALETSMPAIQAGQQQLAVALPPVPIHLDADLTRLSQVISNILNNAAKFTPADGRIDLTAEGHGASSKGSGPGQVIVRIRDTGIGISPDKLETIFDMFGQLESTLKRTQGGLGIGLALARTLTRMHGGSIAAESEGAGRGSTFVVRLPTIAAPASQSADDAAVSSPRAMRRLRVLVTDDMLDSAESIRLLLELEGHDVAIASDGRECLRQVEAFEPDVVLLDVGLPDIDGYEVARRIREQGARPVALVALTGWGSEDDRKLSAKAGFDRHFTKPVAMDALLSYLAERFG